MQKRSKILLSHPGREEYIDTIISTSQKLNDMISNILKLSRLENQNILPDARNYPLGEQLRRCALNFMESWEKKGIHFEIDVSDVIIHYDDSLLELVWNNLLSNAVKFTPPGGKIRLLSRIEAENVIVSVEDTGCGMDSQTSSRIFEKFYQGDNLSYDRRNGLGLALVKRVLALTGAGIRVDSHPGKVLLLLLFCRSELIFPSGFTGYRFMIPAPCRTGFCSFSRINDIRPARCDFG